MSADFSPKGRLEAVARRAGQWGIGDGRYGRHDTRRLNTYNTNSNSSRSSRQQQKRWAMATHTLNQNCQSISRCRYPVAHTCTISFSSAHAGGNSAADRVATSAPVWMSVVLST